MATAAPAPASAVPALEPILVLGSDWGYSGDEFEVEGNGFQAGTYLNEMTLGGMSVMSSAPVEVGEDGSFTTTFVIPPLGSGAKVLYVSTGTNSATAQIYVLLPLAVPTPEPTLILEEIWGYSGDELELNGIGFTPGSYLDQVTLGGISVISAAPVEVGEDGSFTTTFVIPPLSSGAKDLQVYSEASSDMWSTLFYVLVIPPAAAGSN